MSRLSSRSCASMRANHASRSSGVWKIFLFGIVVSFDEMQDSAYSDSYVGECAHHLDDLATVDALLFAHPMSVPGGRQRRKTAAIATSA